LIKSKSTSPWSSEGGVLFIIGLILFLIFSYVFIRNRSEVNKTLNHLTFLSNEFEDIAAGNYLRNFDALREKNLGTIVNSFEKMCISLREKIDDISDSNSKLQELVEEGRKDVTKTLTEKEKLLRVIIHDLSNSLSIVQGNCRVLTRRYPNSDKRYTSSLAAIKKASEGMIEIVHNVRKYSSISDGKVSLDIQILSVRDILKDLLFYFKDKTNQKNIKIKFSPHLDDVNYSILAERSIVIHQVFSNILTNSIKFSAPSSVIEIIVSEESKFIKFEVKDTGVGIPEEKLSDLFKIAEATTTLGTLGEKGTGYGMSLMKAFTEKLDGEIYITSRHINKYSLDHGTSVIIKIPKAEAAQAIA
jgi:signal transduction histidine kinase